jgi:hypothetical protein
MQEALGHRSHFRRCPTLNLPAHALAQLGMRGHHREQMQRNLLGFTL